MTKFQAVMTRKANTGKAQFEQTKVGRVETAGYTAVNRKGEKYLVGARQNAFELLKRANRGWEFTLGAVVEVQMFDYEVPDKEVDNGNQA